MSADAIVKSFIDRILRLKEDQDSLAADIREVYAEAKGNGYDKTAMGQLVAHLRKVEKVGISAVQEGQSIFDLYLEAYERASGTALATHTHEETKVTPSSGDVFADLGVERPTDLPPHDPSTGEITEHEQPETAHQSPPPTHKTAGSAPRDEGSEGANKEHEDVDGSTERAGHAGQPFDALSGQVETRNSDIEFVERNTSGPDAKRAPHSPSAAPPAEAATAPMATEPTVAAPHRAMSISPLEPREAGGLKGFGFTVKFEDKPLNPDCRKAAHGEQCALMHSQALCSKCQQAVDARKAAA